jgi:hypothetical protein
MKQARRTPTYTTCWEDMPVARVRRAPLLRCGRWTAGQKMGLAAKKD